VALRLSAGAARGSTKRIGGRPDVEAAPGSGRLTSLARRIALRTGRTPLRPLWDFGYRFTARAIASALADACPGAAVYLKGSVADGQAIPGLSDIDLIVVAPPGDKGGLDTARRRWQQLVRRFPPLAGLVPHLWLYRQECLAECLAATCLTSGLDQEGKATKAVLLGPSPPADEMGLLQRPGLESPRDDWVPLTGPERRPVAAALDEQERRLRAWLELQEWWRYAFLALSAESSVHTPYVCVKLVAEPARILLWLDGEVSGGDRVSVLELASRLIPQEEPAFHRAIALYRSLPRSPDPPLTDALATLLRLSELIAARLSTAVESVGTTGVRIEGGDVRTAALPAEPQERPVPLADWRACVVPASPDEVVVPLDGNPGEPEELVRAIAQAGSWQHPALRQGNVLVLPTPEPWMWGRLRCVQCPLTDPVTFALLEGSREARFPELSGWSAFDWARRAVAEHASWLSAPAASDARPPGWILAARDSAEPGTRSLGMLFTAARAALFLQSIQAKNPVLPATVGRTAELLGSDLALEARDAYVDARRGSERVDAGLARAFRQLVVDLPSYRGLR
jgi:hypothetical protein